MNAKLPNVLQLPSWRGNCGRRGRTFLAAAGTARRIHNKMPGEVVTASSLSLHLVVWLGLHNEQLIRLNAASQAW